jgi:PPOX class probable F420-dependent enzyme
VVTLTPDQRKLITDKNLAHFVTLMKDGSPQVTPVWVDCDETHILINTAAGRQKPLNLSRDPRVALSIADTDDIYRYIQVRGRVAEVTTEGAFEHISKLARKYRGEDYVYPARPGEQRVIIRIEPLHVSGRL